MKKPTPSWTLNIRETGAIEFVCTHGVGHYPCWARNTVHGCDGCCRLDGFPGREPRVGDLAFCGAATLGLITMGGLQPVHYRDGNKAMAYTGIHMTDAIEEKGSEWSSRNPIIIGTIFEMYNENLPVTTYVVRQMLEHVGGLTWRGE